MEDMYFFIYQDKIDNGDVISIKTIQGKYFNIPKNIFLILEKNTSESGVLSNQLTKKYLSGLRNKGIICSKKELDEVRSFTDESEGIILLKGMPLGIILNFLKKFNSLMFITYYLVVVFFLSFFTYDIKAIKTSFNSASMSMGYDALLMLFLYVLISGLIHELGHSSLFYKYSGKKANIGVTFNYVFPAFFSDVRDSALLGNKNERLAIHFAGVFYQVIFFPIILLPFYMWKSDAALVLLSYMLIIQVFFNLVPFLKNDGYWIYKESFLVKGHEKWIHIAIIRLFLVLGLGYLSCIVVLAGWHFYVNVIYNGMFFFEQPTFDVFRQSLVSCYIIVGVYKSILKIKGVNV